MNRHQTGKKETGTVNPQVDNTTSLRSCQQKTLVNKAIRENLNKFTVYEHCITFKPMVREQERRFAPESRRGCITHFSKRSRFRLFKLLAMIKGNLEQRPFFVSLTYHYGHLNVQTTAKDHLHNFFVQLRNFDPGVGYIWRMEYQIRGAPHFHLIIFPGDPSRRKHKGLYNIEVSKIWHRVADPHSKKHKEFGCRIESIHSYTQACSYLSKYIAKCHDTESDLKHGKHWGNSGELPVKVHHVYSAFDDNAAFLITRIRGWLMANGKEKYADPDFLNIYQEFTVFISKSEFNGIVPDDCVYVLDSS